MLSAKLISRFFSTGTKRIGTTDLFEFPVIVKTRSGEVIPIHAVYQDTSPGGSPTGTVLTLHGSPGSYNDFKYVTPHLSAVGIRTIGINFPGLGLSSYDERLLNDNFERQSFIQAHLDSLQADKVVILGHSRGGENAILTAAHNLERTKALVLVNSTGFYAHRGIRPRFFFLTPAFGESLRRPLWSRPVADWILVRTMQRIGFKVSSGEEAGVTVMHANTFDLARLGPFVARINDSDVAVVKLFGGRDKIIESWISKDMASRFRDMRFLETDRISDTPEDTERLLKLLDSKRCVGMFFRNEGHFLQKTRGLLIAAAIKKVLTT